eukprot:scaffold3572_cov113-Cylindrotheca_fusiformis.AAC.8
MVEGVRQSNNITVIVRLCYCGIKAVTTSYMPRRQKGNELQESFIGNKGPREVMAKRSVFIDGLRSLMKDVYCNINVNLNQEALIQVVSHQNDSEKVSPFTYCRRIKAKWTPKMMTLQSSINDAGLRSNNDDDQ